MKRKCINVYNADVMFYLIKAGHNLEGVCKNYKIPNATVFFFEPDETLEEDIKKAVANMYDLRDGTCN